MKLPWLNDSLGLRADTSKEKQALATLYDAPEPKEPAQQSSGPEETETTSLSIS
jgi:hypothetical protein